MKHFLIFSFLLITATSCYNHGYRRHLADLLEDSIELSGYSKVLLIPGAGCPGCISNAEQYCKSNISDSSILFIFTNISSTKLLRYKLKLNSFVDCPNIILDTTNHFYIQNSVDNIYPYLVEIDQGRITKINPL